jgi:hypothetical protein
MWLVTSNCGAPLRHLRENTAERVNGHCRERVLRSTFALNPSLLAPLATDLDQELEPFFPNYIIHFFARHVQCLIYTSTLQSLIISKS